MFAVIVKLQEVLRGTRKIGRESGVNSQLSDFPLDGPAEVSPDTDLLVRRARL